VDVLLECGAISASKDVLIGLVGWWPPAILVIDVQIKAQRSSTWGNVVNAPLIVGLAKSVYTSFQLQNAANALIMDSLY
jgi:hypothetical protein